MDLLITVEIDSDNCVLFGGGPFTRMSTGVLETFVNNIIHRTTSTVS